MIDISRALAIPGVTPTGRNYYPWLAEQAQSRTTIVEIGCWLGGSARAMADNTAGTVICVDPFIRTPDSQDDALWTDDPEWLWKTFQNNMDGLTNVIPMRMTSLEAARWLQGWKFDMIFHDADHSYDSVKADMLAWRPMLAPGGLLCGHDWAWPTGLTPAVMETGGGHPIGIDSLWIGD